MFISYALLSTAKQIFDKSSYTVIRTGILYMASGLITREIYAAMHTKFKFLSLNQLTAYMAEV